MLTLLITRFLTLTKLILGLSVTDALSIILRLLGEELEEAS